MFVLHLGDLESEPEGMVVKRTPKVAATSVWSQRKGQRGELLIFETPCGLGGHNWGTPRRGVCWEFRNWNNAPYI